MTGYGNATLPRKPGIQAEIRHYICGWRGCTEEYDSPCGTKPRACPKCRATEAYREEDRARRRESHRRSEARRAKR